MKRVAGIVFLAFAAMLTAPSLAFLLVRARGMADNVALAGVFIPIQLSVAAVLAVVGLVCLWLSRRDRQTPK